MQQNNTVQIAVRSRMKLFYRPKNLPGNPSRLIASWRGTPGKNGNGAEPDAVLRHAADMQANGQSIAGAGMVAPFQPLGGVVSGQGGARCSGRPLTTIRGGHAYFACPGQEGAIRCTFSGTPKRQPPAGSL
jgi:hypothetical protein